MAQFQIQTSLAAGEISPSLYGHVDLSKLHSAATTLRNMWVSYRGGGNSRGGTALTVRSLQPYGTPPRLIPFQFNINQGYALEFGNEYMRVISNGAPVVEAPDTITGITQASPAVVTATNSLTDGDWVVIEGVVGMTPLNGGVFIVDNATGTDFELNDLDGNPVDTTIFPAYVSGGTVSRIFTLTTPWADTDLPLLKYTQSADVMTICHQGYPPTDLARESATDWSVTVTTFAADIDPPASVAGHATQHPYPATPPPKPCAYSYVITAVNRESGDESVASAAIDITDSVNIAIVAGALVLDWDPVDGAGTYNIYKAPASYNTNTASNTDAFPVPAGALYGYIGTSYGSEFVDSNIVADLSQVPPIHENPFAPGQIISLDVTAAGTGYTNAAVTITTSTGTGFHADPVIQRATGAIVAWIVVNHGENYVDTDTATITGSGTGATADLVVGPLTGTYPGVPSYFQQRRVYASTLNNPDTYWMTKPGQFQNMDSSIPLTPNDAIVGTPWSLQVNGIQFLVPMPGGLVVFTGLGAWQVTGAGGSQLNPQPITPTSQQAQPQAFNGCSATVPPLAINYDIIYVQAKGSIVRDLAYNYWINIYTGSDLTQLSDQLFTGFTIVQWAWCEEPYRIVWAVRDDGNLLSLTYLKEQEVMAWARHDTQGQVVSVCAVTEPPVDALYLVVARATNPSGGDLVYYIERMDDRIWKTSEDPWCVDCGLRYPMPEPAANLTIAYNGPTNAATFTADASVFPADAVGQVLRAAGGIATVTVRTSGTVVQGTWSLPPTAFVPNDPNGNVVPQASGAWTLTQPTSVVYGLGHLIGLTVTGLADGIPIPPQIVSDAGSVTLARPASNIVVGLGFTAQFQSPYIDVSGGATVQGRRKTITAVTGRVEASSMLQIGSNQPDGAAQAPPVIAPTWTGMLVAPEPDQAPTYTAPGGGTVQKLFTGDIRIPINAGWDKRGQIAIQQVNPVPLSLTAIIPEFLEGDTPEVGYPPSQGGGRKDGQQPRAPGPWMLRE